MRRASIERNTNETKISLTLNLDGSGKAVISTGIGFFDHMLLQVVKHGRLDLDLSCQGDLEVDSHHSIEDIGIALGLAVKEALGDKMDITRYGFFILPMEEALVLCSLDICGRPYLNMDTRFSVAKIGDLDTEMLEEFFRAFCLNSGITLHFKLLDGKNNHHIAEALFKAFGRALRQALSLDEGMGIPSTKGML